MINYKDIKLEQSNKLLKTLKKEYIKLMDITRDINLTFNNIWDNRNIEYQQLQANDDLRKGSILSLIENINNIYLSDKNKTYNAVIDEILKGYNTDEKKKIISFIAKIEAYKHFFDFLIIEKKHGHKNVFKIGKIIKKGEEQGLIENPYENIFKNGEAYQMFTELKNLTVTDKNIVADFSFIYHKMKDKSIYAIKKNVTQPDFIEFLNKNFGTNISVNKLPFKNPSSKQQTFKTILEKYKDFI